jgi:hypothetical protein
MCPIEVGDDLCWRGRRGRTGLGPDAAEIEEKHGSDYDPSHIFLCA